MIKNWAIPSSSFLFPRSRLPTNKKTYLCSDLGRPKRTQATENLRPHLPTENTWELYYDIWKYYFLSSFCACYLWHQHELQHSLWPILLLIVSSQKLKKKWWYERISYAKFVYPIFTRKYNYFLSISAKRFQKFWLQEFSNEKGV